MLSSFLGIVVPKPYFMWVSVFLTLSDAKASPWNFNLNVKVLSLDIHSTLDSISKYVNIFKHLYGVSMKIRRNP